MNKQTHKNEHKSKKQIGRQVRTTGQNVNIMPRQINEVTMFKTLTPNEVMVKFKYTPTFVLSNNGFPNASRSFIANGLFDVDPALASTSVIGFTQWMAMYYNYRVISVSYKVEFSVLDQGNTGVPIIACMAFHNTGFSANAFTEAYFDNPLARSELVTRFQTPKWQRKVNISDIQGGAGPLVESNWEGTPASNPAENVYLTAAVSSVGLATVLPTGGLAMRLLIEFDTLLTHRKELSQ